MKLQISVNGSVYDVRAPDMVFIASSLSAGWPACLSLKGLFCALCAL